MRMSFRMHGMMDYIIGLALLLAPNLLGFADVPVAATVARVIGAIVLLQVLMTRFQYGAVKVIPVRMHLMMDYVIGLVLAVSPWLFGFADTKANAWMPHLIVGLLIIGQAAITRPQPSVADVRNIGDKPRRAA